MKVSVILQKKGSSNVVTIDPDATVGEAVRTMSDHRIGAIVVSETGSSVNGIVSERDIVGRIGAEGPGILSTSVAQVMTSHVECCITEDTALEILARMTDGRFRHMPVLDQNKELIGILSIGDVVKARLEEMETENAAMADMLSG
ncbi:MAG: CBS domain-containing protein [Paracoccaceae bacterium]